MSERKILTLCMVHQHPRLLLGMKKRGFGVGRWNGFGGKVQPGESIETAAKRELFEECGIRPEYMEKRGILHFDFQDPAETPLEVHIYKIEEFTGLPMESEEMKPQWFDFMDIPFREMWPDDLFWVPIFLKGRTFRGRFLFDKASTPEYQSQIIERELVEVAELE